MSKQREEKSQRRQAMTEATRDKVEIPECLGGNIIIKIIQKKVTSGGIYIPTEDEGLQKTKGKCIEELCFIEDMGPDIADAVKEKLSIGDRVYVHYMGGLHPIFHKETTEREDIAYFFCRPEHILGKYK